MSKTSRPRVYVRVRPLSKKEVEKGKTVAFNVEAQTDDTLVCEKDGETVRTRFDKAFGTQTTQQEMFNHIGKEVVDSLASGYNASVFAYGQTGSGKTFTMEGDLSDKDAHGLTPRLLTSVFERLKTDPNVSDLVAQMSYVQIYQEKIQDLLNERRQLEIHMDRDGSYIAQGATWQDITGMEHAMRVYNDASKLRATNATEMNLVSSRSHAITMIRLQ